MGLLGDNVIKRRTVIGEAAFTAFHPTIIEVGFATTIIGQLFKAVIIDFDTDIDFSGGAKVFVVFAFWAFVHSGVSVVSLYGTHHTYG